MEKSEVIQRVDAILQGRRPAQVKLTRYLKFSEWALPSENATEADFIEAQSNTDALAEEMTRRGVKVLGVNFDPSKYNLWRGIRDDTRNLRAQWAVENKDKIQVAFVVAHNSIGWTVLKT